MTAVERWVDNPVPRHASRRMFPRARRTLAVAIAIATLLPPLAPALHAQESAPPPHRTPRRVVLAIAGAVVGLAAGIGFSKGSKSEGSGACAKIQCVVIGSTLLGAAFGYIVGRESDLAYASRYRGLPPLHPENTTTDLEGTPVAFDVADSMVAVGGSDGVQTFRVGSTLTVQAMRAGALRGIATVAIARHSGAIAIGSPNGLYLYPPRTGPGEIVREGDVAATASGWGRIYFGVDDRVEVAPISADTTRAWPGVAAGATVRALAIDSARSIVWAVTDRELVALHAAGDSLSRIGALALDGAGRRLALRGDTVAVALGQRGIRLYDAVNPAAPRRLADWHLADFSYDVAFGDDRLFVAAGPEGVYVLSLTGGTLRTLGLARDLGFASALASYEGYTYILDRRANALRRLLSDF